MTKRNFPVNPTTLLVARKREDRLTNLKLALLHLHPMAAEDAGCDPYNSREGTTRSDAWAGPKAR